MKNVLFLMMLSVAMQGQKAPSTVFVEGGTFSMGDGETAHEVNVQSFSIGTYEITIEEYRAFCIATGHPLPPGMEHLIDAVEWEKLPTHGMDEVRMRYEAVQNVSYDDAQAYCKWLTGITKKVFRLPTESEWEFAARGGNKSRNFKYSGSNSIADVGWSYSTMPKDTLINGSDSSNFEIAIRSSAMQTGLLQANELGIFDMSGNVWEWCDGSANAAPKKTIVLQNRQPVLRGGSAIEENYVCEINARAESTEPSSHTGFRICLEN